ncbi:MAG: hypothetical protein JWN86_2006 [Planctomycetota bacterium]|nr:hypothetical protein [Planctomycetota bacterium]
MSPGRKAIYYRVGGLASLVLAALSMAAGLDNEVWYFWPEIPVLGLIFWAPLGLVLSVLGGGPFVHFLAATMKWKWTLSLGLLFLIVTVLLRPSNGPAREFARGAQTVNNIKQIGLGLFNYESALGTLPPAAICDKAGKPLLSWRVLILPYLEQGELYNQFHLNEPWDSPHNLTLVNKMPASYAPVGRNSDPGKTYMQAFVGPGTAFEGAEGERLTVREGRSNFPDGPGQTILFVEAGKPVPWSAPIDIPYGVNVPIPVLGGSYRRKKELFHLPPATEFYAQISDGTVKRFPWSLPASRLRAMITRNGGEPAGIPTDR